MEKKDFPQEQEEERLETSVGKSETVMEGELIQLMEKANRLEKEHLYEEAIEILEKVKKMVEFKEGVEKKIEELRGKMKRDFGSTHGIGSDFDLEKELDALSEEAKSELPPDTSE